MEEDQEMKHACKFCNKSFPCGRSLGGHMRSHITNLSAHTISTKKPSSSTNNNGSGCNGSEAGYGLRENPKKTWRIADSSEDTLVVYDKFCKECGKSFHSWKALFGHMKCHSDKERVSNSLEDQDSWTTQKLIVDSQSDNEITAPNKKRRSKRSSGKRHTVVPSAAATSSANPSSSLSEVEQEQEEVAMSLMMLSRDVNPWIPVHSLAHSSDNNFAYFEARSSLQTKFDGNNKSTKKLEFGNSVSKNFNFKGKSSELLETENGFKMNKTGVSIKRFIKASNFELDNLSTLEDSEGEHGKKRVNGTESVEFSKNSSNKRGKFACTSCNKIFHSYQALGGHRASHKKLKGCFASRIESSENSIETQFSPDPITENKLMKKSEYVHEAEVETVRVCKKSKGHECPICFKVFPSGQALGGHKRSHMSGGSESTRNFQTVVLEEPVQEIRDFLDLNLPAANDEESNSHADSNRPWWVVEGLMSS